MRKIGFIGCGHMAQALIKGLKAISLMSYWVMTETVKI